MAPPARSTDRTRLTLPRLTDRVFTDLKIWMAMLGVLVGLAFPLLSVLLGVPSDVALRPVFFLATVLAGLALVGVTHKLARIVIGGQLHRLTDRMSFVSESIAEAALSGNAEACTPESCRLTVDSRDGFGHAARSFNSLLEAVFTAKQTEITLATFSSLLSQHLEVADLAEAALGRLVSQAGASAGAFVCLRDGECTVAASHGLVGLAELLESSPIIREAERTGRTQVIDAPDGLVIDGGLMSLRPRQSLIMPILYNEEVIAVVVLAMIDPLSTDQVRVLELLREPLAVALNNARTHERFQLMAAVDPLTGAYNRRFGEQRLSEEFARSIRGGQPLGVVSLDIDHFKLINDTHGHTAGDKVLKYLSEGLMTNSRHGDILIRTGGEEFLMLLPGASLKDVEGIGERMRQFIAQMSIDIGDQALNITASLGGASFPDCAADSYHELLELSDKALYRSKHGGRDKLTLVVAA